MLGIQTVFKIKIMRIIFTVHESFVYAFLLEFIGGEYRNVAKRR